MRVTNKNLLKNYMTNINRNLLSMQKFQNQLSSGKEISRPSDDPFKVTRAMALDSSINRNNQHLRNIEDSIGWIDVTDTTLKASIDALQRVRELTIQGANASYSPEDLISISEEVGQVINQIAQIGNANYDGRYVMGGHNTTQPPFDVNAGQLLNVNGDNGNIVRELSANVTISVNVSADSFLGTSGEDLGITLKNIYDRLINNQQSDLINDSISKIDGHIDRLLGQYAEVGAKYNRLIAAKEKNEAETLNMTELLSKTEDIDFAEKIMQYSMMENVYQASLATGGRILQPTLLNYLR